MISICVAVDTESGKNLPEIVGHWRRRGDRPAFNGRFDCLVLLQRLHQALREQTRPLLQTTAHRYRHQHDRQRGVDGIGFAVIDRTGLQVRLCQPKRLLNLEQLTVSPDDLLGGEVGAAGFVALDRRRH